MKLIRLTLSFIFVFIFYSSVSFAERVTNDQDLQRDMKMLGTTFSNVYYYAVNCNDDVALERMIATKKRVIYVFREANFDEKSINYLDDYIERRLKLAQGYIDVSTKNYCEREKLIIYIDRLEDNYNKWREDLQFYIPSH